MHVTHSLVPLPVVAENTISHEISTYLCARIDLQDAAKNACCVSLGRCTGAVVLCRFGDRIRGHR